MSYELLFLNWLIEMNTYPTSSIYLSFKPHDHSTVCFLLLQRKLHWRKSKTSWDFHHRQNLLWNEHFEEWIFLEVFFFPPQNVFDIFPWHWKQQLTGEYTPSYSAPLLHWMFFNRKLFFFLLLLLQHLKHELQWYFQGKVIWLEWV